MADNHAHSGESLEKRTLRFQNNSPIEIIETLLNSIDNHFNNEIRITTENDNYQSTLLFLGIHAVALTVAEGVFNKRGLEGFRFFLKKFVDGGTEDKQFSTIAETIHNWRNTVAHHWLAASGHGFGYDYAMDKGWEVRDEILFINPRIYRDCYLAAFSAGGRIWRYDSILQAEGMEQAKERLVTRFLSK